MAKDGTMRGGARVGSGRKQKALTEKIDSGFAASVIDLPEPEDISGEDVPPVKDFLKAAQKSGIGLCEEVFEDKEYVVILDYIGNYMNNSMVLIALSGDRTYNKDTIRRYFREEAFKYAGRKE